MVRAATWLHFGSGAAARPRVSTTVTSIPRHARSIASVSPTGPAPTISTSGSVIAGIDRAWCGRLYLRTWFSSFRLGAGIFDDGGPAIDLGLDEGGKTVRRRTRQRLQRNRGEFFARCRIGHQLSDLRGQWVDDRRGTPAGATTPCHATSSKPGSPASASVGISGATATRLGVVTPSTLTLPSLICGRAGCRSTTMNGICPAITSSIAGTLPRYGT